MFGPFFHYIIFCWSFWIKLCYACEINSNFSSFHFVNANRYDENPKLCTAGEWFILCIVFFRFIATEIVSTFLSDIFVYFGFLLFHIYIFLFVAKRPPVEETASFLQSLLASHGPNYLEKLFGSKARDALQPLGGVEKVAIALSESQTIEDFGAAMHLMRWVNPNKKTY